MYVKNNHVLTLDCETLVRLLRDNGYAIPEKSRLAGDATEVNVVWDTVSPAFEGKRIDGSSEENVPE